MSLVIVAYGRPAPQGSKTFYGSSATGKGRFEESSKKVKPWRDDVKAAAEREVEHCANRGCDALKPGYPLDGPIAVRMVFTMPKPASAPKRRRTWPDRMPDLSKLVRSTEDALTSAGVWVDDARVVQMWAAKTYPNEGSEALDRPGVRIEIHPIEAGDG